MSSVGRRLLERRLGDTLVRYDLHEPSGTVQLRLWPWSLRAQLKAARGTLDEQTGVSNLPSSWRPVPASAPDSIVHAKLAEDCVPAAFAQGRTLRGSGTKLRFKRQEISSDSKGVRILTTLRSRRGLVCHHELGWSAHNPSHFSSRTVACNAGNVPITLELLTSFSVGGITPFARDSAPGRLFLHRFRSNWSAEGRHDVQSFEELHLEPSWLGWSSHSERFGQVGTLPVRGWFPWAAVEDRQQKVFWGAQIAWPGSWQMELYRRDDRASLSGGLADLEFGHWAKVLKPGERLEAPLAYLACATGTIDDLADRLTDAQKPAVSAQPARELELPIVVNEWCTSWGKPTHKNIVALARKIRGRGISYLVIDAGWFAASGNNSGQTHGDWIPNRRAFPQGLKATAEAIRAQGLIPGLWFEMETVHRASKAFHSTAHLLKSGGRPITTVQGRRFWDMRDPWVTDYLSRRVIKTLEEAGFGYLKVDYNDTVGIGCDGEPFAGEGLRQQTAASLEFFRKIRRDLPGLVIENCASGGHRLEPALQGLCAMGSFSDAHETPEIPLIAANLHRLTLPRQLQIWAVLRRGDTPRRLAYSLVATFLGRVCLSGDLTKLTPAQWKSVDSALEFYRRVRTIIRDGRSRRFGSWSDSWRNLTGWQAVRREDVTGTELLVIAHRFGGGTERRLRVPLPHGRWAMKERWPHGGTTRLTSQGYLEIELERWAAGAFHLVRR